MKTTTGDLGRGVLRRGVSHVAELLILGLLAVGAVAVPVSPSPTGLMYALDPAHSGQSLEQLLGTNLSIGGGGLVVLLWLVLLSRLTRRASVFVALGMAFPVAALAWFHWAKVLPVVREVSATLAHDFAPTGIPMSMATMSLRSGLVVLVPVLVALYATRLRWSPLLYGLGWAGGLAVMYAEFYAWWDTRWDVALLVGVVLNGGFAAALVSLPLQRRRMEALTGIALGGGEAQPVSPLASTLGHLALVLIAASTLLLSAASYYEQRFNRVLAFGPEPPHFSPGLWNAYPILKEHFSKPAFGRSRPPTHAESVMQTLEKEVLLGSPERELLGGVPVMNPNDLEAYLGTADRARLDKYLAAMAPYFAVYEEASRADICVYNEPGRAVLPSFLTVRTVSRALDLRASLAVLEGRTSESLRDIEALFGFARVLGSDPCGTLVQHMVAAAVRGIGVSALQNHYLATRDNPEAARALADLIERLRPAVHQSFPFETIKRTEAGFWPLAVYYEMVVPAMNRAYLNFYSKWAAFDQVRLLLALDAWRADHGEYPKTLDVLAPQYLVRVPRDPYEGKPYGYELRDGEPVVFVEFMHGPDVKGIVSGMLPDARTRQKDGASHLERIRRTPAEARAK